MSRDGKTILVLEPDPAVRFALERVSLGPDISLMFVEPAEWMNVEMEYAVVLADDMFLQGSGDKLPLTLLKERLKKPVILMTSTGNRRMEGFARDAGATSVLFKPFSVGELRRHIGNVVGGLEYEAADTAAEVTVENSAAAAPVYRPVEFGGQIAGDQIFDSLFTELEKRQPLEEGLDAFDVVERQLVKRALLACDGNQSQASRFLGITRNTLRKRIRKYGFSSLLTGDEASDSEDE